MERVRFEPSGDFLNRQLSTIKRHPDDILSTRTQTPPEANRRDFLDLAHLGRSAGSTELEVRRFKDNSSAAADWVGTGSKLRNGTG